uniref:Trafficking protein particle complex subunit n=1 Tax=Anopheles stephensi TaxID=30069 RepID=A0A182YSG1_ANOST
MTIYNLYIFDKLGTLLYYGEWNRLKQSGITKDEEAKLMYGMLFSIKSFVSKISPIEPREGFLYYKTNKYALHYLEIWVEYVVRNPLWTIGTPVTSDIFKAKLDDFVKQSPLYGSKII